MQTITVADSIAETLNPLSQEERKKRVLSENGITIADEEEILSSKNELVFDTPLKADDYLKHLDKIIAEFDED